MDALLCQHGVIARKRLQAREFLLAPAGLCPYPCPYEAASLCFAVRLIAARARASVAVASSKQRSPSPRVGTPSLLRACSFTSARTHSAAWRGGILVQPGRQKLAILHVEALHGLRARHARPRAQEASPGLLTGHVSEWSGRDHWCAWACRRLPLSPSGGSAQRGARTGPPGQPGRGLSRCVIAWRSFSCLPDDPRKMRGFISRLLLRGGWEHGIQHHLMQAAGCEAYENVGWPTG
jgi:hypothetical protein